MAIIDVNDLLERAVRLERELEAYYAHIRDESEDNGVRLLTYYLSRHRRRVEQALSSYENEILAKIRAVKLKHDIPFSYDKVLAKFKQDTKEMRGKALLEAAAEHDMALIGLYKAMLAQPIGEQATTLVESLLRVEERDIVMIRKMIAMNYF